MGYCGFVVQAHHCGLEEQSSVPSSALGLLCDCLCPPCWEGEGKASLPSSTVMLSFRTCTAFLLRMSGECCSCSICLWCFWLPQCKNSYSSQHLGPVGLVKECAIASPALHSSVSEWSHVFPARSLNFFLLSLARPSYAMHQFFLFVFGGKWGRRGGNLCRRNCRHDLA